MKTPHQLLPALAMMGALATFAARAADLTQPIADASLVFEERDGIVAVEAEHFYKQTLTDKRAWHITSSKADPDLKPDGDPAHLAGASGGKYIQVLPDTRRSHDDKLFKGENFTDEPGAMAVLEYPFEAKEAGRYFVWARSLASRPDTNESLCPDRAFGNWLDLRLVCVFVAIDRA